MSSVGTIGEPEVVGEVAAAFAAYERALVDRDLDALQDAFWDCEQTVRYGIAERLYGARAIDAWRRADPGVPPGRRIGRTVIAAFGRDTACVSAEFANDGIAAIGRQTQTWVRIDGRWRIVAAHVSLEER